MKILLLLLTLTLLASCTHTELPTNQTPPVMKEEVPSVQPQEVIQKDNTINIDEPQADTDTMESYTKEDMGGDEMMNNEPQMMKPTGYVNYDEAKLTEALASGQKVALFFHAAWCPSCRALDTSINANLSSIPYDALIVKVDYDSSTEMKKKYGVTNQHTTVLIDKDMNLIAKKLGAKNITEVLN
jgi:thiol-disulfide isomerase/thioredoxin